ncbi:MAG: acetolactate decarboxylase [Candidatus Omnitrophica bacterium]|nr:acetolactate decarboxylase [Candidatus Omnitrophota bacterium]
MKAIRYILLTVLFVLSLTVHLYAQEDSKDVLFQVSTIDALLEGGYDGEMTYDRLSGHGDFGIGTFNALNGEMVALDGNFYRVNEKGEVSPVSAADKTPFAAVTFFEADKNVKIGNIAGFNELGRYLDEMLPTKNIFYAVKIDGTFDYIKVRSVPKQDKPYPPITEVVKNQPVFEFYDQKGTIVGFRCPAYISGMNVPGYHFHFLSEDRSKGGHLLECDLAEGSAGIDYTSEFCMVLPENEEFYRLDLTQDKQVDINQVER